MTEQKPDPLDEVYEKFKHLDVCLGDTGWCGAVNNVAIYGIAGELWRAIKESHNKSYQIPEILICPCEPNSNGFCTFPQNCIAKRMMDQEDCDKVCTAMQSLRRNND